LSSSSARSCTAGTFCSANSTSAGGSDNCPPRWYCPPGVDVPLPTPPGHFVGRSGSVYPSKCPPGTFAADWLMLACDPCPAGQECPLDGTIVPTVCRPGTYREATPDGVDPTTNVMCTPCPQGTWSQQGGLTAVLDCKNCDERYVCPTEGTVRFATVDSPCPANAAPTDICYENSEGWDCPQGYACPAATTAFTQYEIPCDPGFWCKVRTLPWETRNLLCPEGYYCPRNTGESGRFAFQCPSNSYCPKGTESVQTQAGNRVVTTLSNVQAKEDVVTRPDARPNRDGAMCRNCPDSQGPGNFDLTRCTRCGIRRNDRWHEFMGFPITATRLLGELPTQILSTSYLRSLKL
jgi:hypothetical protein